MPADIGVGQPKGTLVAVLEAQAELGEGGLQCIRTGVSGELSQRKMVEETW